MIGGAPLPVFLFRDESVLAIAEARDVGPAGMIVTPVPRFTDPLPRGCPLEVGVAVEQGAITRRFRIPVRVVVQEEGELGLAFQTQDPTLVEVVTRALRDRPPPP